MNSTHLLAKSKNFRKSGYAKAEVPLSKICDLEIKVSAEAEVPLTLSRKLPNLSQCNRALALHAADTFQVLYSRASRVYGCPPVLLSWRSHENCAVLCVYIFFQILTGGNVFGGFVESWLS